MVGPLGESGENNMRCNCDLCESVYRMVDLDLVELSEPY